MRTSTGSRFLAAIIGAFLITSFVNIFTPTMMIPPKDNGLSLFKEPFRVATTFDPGDYPDGLTLVDGDVLNGTSGDAFNITGNFTIASGATVTIVPGYKIVVYADNIIINGTLDCDSSGYAGGKSYGTDGVCIPASGGGGHGMDIGGGGGGGAHGSNGQDGIDSETGLGDGGSGGLEYGVSGFASTIPTVSDISLGAGGGVGGRTDRQSSYGTGGDGGGGIYLEALDMISISGTITCDGENGENAPTDPLAIIGGGGGGGGAGGGILLYGDIIHLSGVLTTEGGSGGLGDTLPIYSGGDGGAGSGGRIKIAYLSYLNTTGSTISEGIDGTFDKYQADPIKPTIELTGTGNNTIHKSGTPIVANISDSRNIQLVRYNWDSRANYTIQLNDSSYQLVTQLPAVDGTHTLEVFAQDLPGNWNHQTFTYITDDTSPIITLRFPNNNTVHHSESLIDLTVSDAISLDQVLYNWDGLGDNESVSEPFEILLPGDDGLHNLTIYAYDMANNLESRSYSFVTDDTLPSVTSPDDISFTEGASGLNVSWVLTDANPSTYSVFKDDSLIESDVWMAGVEVIIDIDGLLSGVYTYTIVVHDEANNLAIDTVIVTVLEVTPTSTIPTTTTTSTSTTSTTTVTTSTAVSTSSVPTTSSTPSTTSSESATTNTPTSTTPPPGMDSMVIVVVGVGALGAVIVIVIVIVKRRS